MSEPCLIGEAMTGGYPGGADILHGCTVAVERGEIAVVVGPNGAGKSTAMRALFGMLELRSGSVRLDGEDIGSLSPQHRAARGMGFVPQTANVFPSMSVEENLEMGAYLRTDDIRATMAEVFELFPVLADKRRQAAGELSGGQRQQVAVGRALMIEPKVLMLDEPTAGGQPRRHERAARAHPRRRGHGAAGADGRAERAPGAGDRGPRLRAGAGGQRVHRHRGGAAGRSRGAPELSRRMRPVAARAAFGAVPWTR